ncbi:MarR family winged helix-turn-helix transcriptional regulator [Microbacterium oleivorans]|uniref:MarR family winged helix-turn-helix transcriptional regulator n=1 Tax=Microbacterium oleivorans TaxID=273677 RepID=UPI001404C13B|nr:MarR family transcriptional regulator [Microbacterium oleivorans]
MARRIDDGNDNRSGGDTHGLAEVESSAVAALVRLVGYWTSEDFQGMLARNAGVNIESRDVPALFMLARLGAVRPNVLARALRVSAGNVSKMLDRLAARGFTVRQADPADARASRVTLTRSGAKSAALLNQEGDRLFADLLRLWAPGDVIAFSAMLVRFADGVARIES